MLRDYKEQDKNIIHSITFDNIEEVLKYIEETPVNTSFWGNNIEALLSRNPKRYDVCQTKNLDEAIELCRYGNFEAKKDILKIGQVLNFNVPCSLNTRKTTLSSHGYRPDIPRNIMGHPNQMYRIVRDESKKFINIYYNVVEGSGSSVDAIYNKGILAIKLVDLLEKLGYRVNFNFFELSEEYCFGGKTEYFYFKMNIKNFNEKLDPDICYFPICHPSFLRRIIPAVKETIEFSNNEWTRRYGQVVKKDKQVEIIGVNEEDILISSCRDLGIIGIDIYKDVQNFIKNINLSKYLDEGSKLEFNEKSKTFVLTTNNKRR